jgi:predicted N-acetyltransferase YhbS
MRCACDDKTARSNVLRILNATSPSARLASGDRVLSQSPDASMPFDFRLPRHPVRTREPADAPAVEALVDRPSAPAASPRSSERVREGRLRRDCRSAPCAAAAWSARCGCGTSASAARRSIFLGPLAVDRRRAQAPAWAAILVEAPARRGPGGRRLAVLLVGDAPYFTSASAFRRGQRRESSCPDPVDQRRVMLRRGPGGGDLAGLVTRGRLRPNALRLRRRWPTSHRMADANRRTGRH